MVLLFLTSWTYHTQWPDFRTPGPTVTPGLIFSWLWHSAWRKEMKGEAAYLGSEFWMTQSIWKWGQSCRNSKVFSSRSPRLLLLTLCLISKQKTGWNQNWVQPSMPVLSDPISPARAHGHKLPKQCHWQGPRVQIMSLWGVGISGLNNHTSHGSLACRSTSQSFQLLTH